LEGDRRGREGFYARAIGRVIKKLQESGELTEKITVVSQEGKIYFIKEE
jgi:hypothetical protein